MLFTILADCPMPGPPVCTIRPSMGVMTCSARATVSLSPPIMNVSVPAAAPLIPPETGASTNAKPFSATAL